MDTAIVGQGQPIAANDKYQSPRVLCVDYMRDVLPVRQGVRDQGPGLAGVRRLKQRGSFHGPPMQRILKCEYSRRRRRVPPCCALIERGEREVRGRFRLRQGRHGSNDTASWEKVDAGRKVGSAHPRPPRRWRQIVSLPALAGVGRSVKVWHLETGAAQPHLRRITET